jgi:hypothetical protein
MHLGKGMPGDANERGDHWVLRSFAGDHAGGRVTAVAHNEAVPHGQKLVIDLAGLRVPLGEPLKKALAVYKLGPVWEVMAPRGACDFTARVTLTDTAAAPKVPTVTLPCSRRPPR